MSDFDNDRVPVPQSKRSLRIGEQRRINHYEPKGPGVEVYATGDADTVAVDSATPGDGISVQGIDRITLLVEAVKGSGDVDGVVIAAEVSYAENPAKWYTFTEDDPATPGETIAWTRSYAIAADADFAFPPIEPAGYAMRFVAGTTGTSRTNSRLTITALREMRSQ